MDSPNCNTKNILVELESLRSKESIYKMKETNFLRDKEILEDSIAKFQNELQEKLEIIHSLRRDLNTQSSNLYKDLQIKNNELEKVVLENEDLKKQNVIFQETIDHQAQRIETFQLEMDKQMKLFERELECKSRLAGFYESSSQQKDNKLSGMTEENEQYKQEINDLNEQLRSLKEINEDMSKNYEESLKQMKKDLSEKDSEIQRIKNEIIQLQQNGISEFHLEKTNPVAAATLKVFKASKGLMDIYSELHSKISEVDHLQMDKTRLKRNNDSLESELRTTKIYVDKLKSESDELTKMNESLKSRLLSLVTDLRTSQSKQSDIERQLLVSRKNLQASNNEIERLNEQVRLLIVVAENGSQIKQEAVDADSGLYASVSELQEINRALRLHNEDLITQLESGDSEQYKRKCEELQKYSDKITDEVNQLRQENSVNKSQLILHEKQIQLLRYLIELKSPGSSIAIENGLKLVEFGKVVNLDCDDDEHEPEPIHLSFDNVTKEECSEQMIQQQEYAINEFLENKRASDEVYMCTIEQMRIQLMELSKKSNDLRDKLETSLEKLNYETEMNEKYQQECNLLRSINKNLSSNSVNLESVIEDLKIKLQAKISLVAEKKADLESCKNMLDVIKSENLRLKFERDDLSKTIDVQEKIISNMSSLKNGIELADHFNKIHNRNKIENLEKSLEKSIIDLKEKEEITKILISQLEESKALLSIRNSTSLCDMSCQVDFSLFDDFKTNEEINKIIIDEGALINCKNQIAALQMQLVTDKSESDKLILELKIKIEKYENELRELTEKCAFLETQISLQEKARQEILSENIKITEEAHKMNASLKQDLHISNEELSAMKIRLEEAETVERTVQEVIDKYIKETNEAKAKYKRELTLHASDSKLLDTTRKEIEILQSSEKSFEEERAKLKCEMKNIDETRKQQVEEIQSRYKDLEIKLQECENRNERLYEQLKEISCQSSNSNYMEIIEDLKNQVDIKNMSSNLSDVQRERYENEILRLREELSDMKNESKVAIDRLNKRLSGSSVSLALDPEVIRESNHVLRQQKEQLERSLINVKFEIEDLTEQVSVLESGIAELTEQKNSLMQNKTELEDEKNRWKERCTKLVERAEQMDPEQYRLACNDRDKFRKLVQELEINLKETKESDKLKLEKYEEKIKDLVKDQEIARLDREKLAELTNKLKREENIVLQLKEIGRKHKGESEKRRQSIIDLEKQLSDFHQKLEMLSIERENLMMKLNTKETECELTAEQLKELRTRCDILEKVNKSKEYIIGELNQNIEQLKSEETCRKNLKRSIYDSDEDNEKKRQKLEEDTESSSNSEFQKDEQYRDQFLSIDMDNGIKDKETEIKEIDEDNEKWSQENSVDNNENLDEKCDLVNEVEDTFCEIPFDQINLEIDKNEVESENEGLDEDGVETTSEQVEDNENNVNDEEEIIEDYEESESSEEDEAGNESVVILENETDDKEDSIKDEDFDNIVLEIENSLENVDKNIEEVQENESNNFPQTTSNDSNISDSLWTDKLLNMVVASSSTAPEISKNQIEHVRPMTRGRLRRQLRRSNQTTD